LRVGIHGDDRLAVQVFGGVDDKAVNPDGDDEVGRGEEEVREETAFDGLDFGEGFEGLVQGFDGGVIGVVLAFIKGEGIGMPSIGMPGVVFSLAIRRVFAGAVPGALVDVEPGLRFGVETFDQPLQAGFAGDEDDFFVGHYFGTQRAQKTQILFLPDIIPLCP